MAKGSQIKLLRVPEHLLNEIAGEIVRRNRRCTAKKINFSEWARQAFREKLDHAKRSKPRKRSEASASDEEKTCKHGRTFRDSCATCDREYDGLNLQPITILIAPDASVENGKVEAHETNPT